MSSVQIQTIVTAEDRIRAALRGEWVHIYLGTVMFSLLTAQADELHVALGKALQEPRLATPPATP